MDGSALERGAANQGAATRLDHLTLHVLFVVRGVAVIRSETIGVAFAAKDEGGVRLAKGGCRGDQRVKHRLQVEGGAADDLEHVGGRGLLLEGLAQLIE